MTETECSTDTEYWQYFRAGRLWPAQGLWRLQRKFQGKAIFEDEKMWRRNIKRRRRGMGGSLQIASTRGGEEILLWRKIHDQWWNSKTCGSYQFRKETILAIYMNKYKRLIDLIIVPSLIQIYVDVFCFGGCDLSNMSTIEYMRWRRMECSLSAFSPHLFSISTNQRDWIKKSKNLRLDYLLHKWNGIESKKKSLKRTLFPQKRGLHFSGSRRVASGEQLVFKLHLRFYPAATIIQANWHITNTATANSTLLLSSTTRRLMADFSVKKVNFLPPFC